MHRFTRRRRFKDCAGSGSGTVSNVLLQKLLSDMFQLFLKFLSFSHLENDACANVLRLSLIFISTFGDRFEISVQSTKPGLMLYSKTSTVHSQCGGEKRSKRQEEDDLKSSTCPHNNNVGPTEDKTST